MFDHELVKVDNICYTMHQYFVDSILHYLQLLEQVIPELSRLHTQYEFMCYCCRYYCRDCFTDTCSNAVKHVLPLNMCHCSFVLLLYLDG